MIYSNMYITGTNNLRNVWNLSMLLLSIHHRMSPPPNPLPLNNTIRFRSISKSPLILIQQCTVYAFNNLLLLITESASQAMSQTQGCNVGGMCIILRGFPMVTVCWQVISTHSEKWQYNLVSRYDMQAHRRTGETFLSHIFFF